MTRLPPRSRKAGVAASRPAHSAKERPSFHRMAGRSGRSSAPSRVAPCIWPARPMPRTDRRTAGSMARTAAQVACHQATGSCCDHRGCGRWMVSGAVPCATSVPDASTTTALTPDVPISMPRNMPSVLERIDGLDAAVRGEVQLRHLGGAQVVFPRRLRVVVEQPPLALKFHDRMVRGPALNGLQDMPRIAKRTVGRGAGGVVQIMRVAGRIGEIIGAAPLEHPGGLEEAALVIAAEDGLAPFVEDDDRARAFRELLHVCAHPGDARGDRGLVVAVQVRVAGLGLVAIALPALQLATPDAAEIHVAGAVAIGEDGGVDREAAADRLGIGLERAGGVGCPGLFRGPGDLFHVERDGVDGDRAPDPVHAEHAIIVHRILVTEIVVGDAGVDVVAGIDVESAVEDVRGWIGEIEVFDQRLCEVALAVGAARFGALREGEAARQQSSEREQAGAAGGHRYCPS
ncbi:hypothetical protein WR25_06553 [Diploscapter pachys]|uniref:Uncharacterized protein n=1 Tax=Diploscapter pachys TaxID=2018661 RepID=A0A2A2K7Z8_9BILA|nr:hypothetical protein WR25_06553 [Diploscapter pachys]